MGFMLPLSNRVVMGEEIMAHARIVIMREEPERVLRMVVTPPPSSPAVAGEEFLVLKRVPIVVALWVGVVLALILVPVVLE